MSVCSKHYPSLPNCPTLGRLNYFLDMAMLAIHTGTSVCQNTTTNYAVVCLDVLALVSDPTAGALALHKGRTAWEVQSESLI